MALTFTKASGEDIGKLMDRINIATTGAPTTHVSMACIALALMNVNPNLTPEQVTEGVKECSTWLATYAATVDGNIN